MPEEIVLIQPVAVVRDTDGWWHHPDLPVFEEEQGEESREWVKAQGLTIVTAEMEYEVDTDNDPTLNWAKAPARIGSRAHLKVKVGSCLPFPIPTMARLVGGRGG